MEIDLFVNVTVTRAECMSADQNPLPPTGFQVELPLELDLIRRQREDHGIGVGKPNGLAYGTYADAKNSSVSRLSLSRVSCPVFSKCDCIDFSRDT